MTDPVAIGGPADPTPDERTMAILAHVLQVVGWWIAPLIIFLVKRESRFVSFHALQALFLQIIYAFVMMIIMVLWVGTAFLSMAHAARAPNTSPPPAFFLVFPLMWLGFMGGWALMLVVAIVYGVKAGRGEWAEYPILGSLARRVLKMGPLGVSLQS
jgi:uncharacterized protein